MWECNYAKEPMDFKLFLLLFLKKIWIFIAAVLIGSLLVGGSYFVKHVILVEEDQYKVVAETYIDYVWDDAYGISRVYLDGTVWSMLVKSDVFVDDIASQLNAEGLTTDKEIIRNSVDAELISDSRIVTTTVITADAELSVAISRALQVAILHYADIYEGMEGARNLTTPDRAQKVIADVHVVRAALIGAIAGATVAILLMFLYFTLDDSVYVPVTFERRYKLPMLGTMQSKELTENVKYLCRECRTVVVATVAQELSADQVIEQLQNKMKEAGEESVISFTGVSGVLEMPQNVEKLRNADGVIVAVSGSRGDGKYIEKTLEFLKKQDCKIIAAILCEADETLIRLYYGLGIAGKKR